MRLIISVYFFIILLCFGQPLYLQNDFDVDFIAGYLDGEKSILFFRNVSDGEGNSDLWLSINVVEASIRGYSCLETVDPRNSFRNYGNCQCTYAKSFSTSQAASNLEIFKSSSRNIPKNIFKQFTLKSFSMINQRVAHLSEDNLVGASYLENLNLSQNEIAELSSNVFSSVTELKWLDMSFNKIYKISSSTFSALNKIETIKLNDNQLTIMYLSCFRPTVKKLFFNGNSIRQLNGNIFDNNVLESVQLEDNALEDVSLLDSLSVNIFNVSNNPLRDHHVPIKVNAQIIDISNASIKTCYISQSVVEMKANNNNITSILVSILSDESVDFSITHLYLSGNLLTSFSNISHFKKLVSLDLSHNLIEIVEMSIVSDMLDLSWLSLSHNKIQKIDFQTTTNPISVKYFNVAYNQLENFKLNAPFLYLNELHLEGNKLREIDTKMKLMAPHLLKIGLNNNQWSCSYLSTSVMFLRLEGITLAFLEDTTSLLKTLNSYDDDVLGIGCFNSQVQENKELVAIRPGLSEDSVNEVVNANLNSKMKDLETKLLDSFNLKFTQIFNLLNQTTKN